MDPVFNHRPVMVDEVVDLFAPVPPGLIVDATMGGGGHSAALLSARLDTSVLGIDRDERAIASARTRLAPYGGRAQLRHARFDVLSSLVGRDVTGADEPGVTSEMPVTGVLFDLGVSSPQIDQAERGFSFRQDGPLDMRMDTTDTRTAADVVNELSEPELASLFAANGEQRFARRIARAIVVARPITTTSRLAGVVRDSIPAPARTRGHPARRVFQALRIAVNEELEVLASTLPLAIGLLAPGGRCVVISYHSGEDRLVKSAFADAASGGCVCPPHLPCVCGAVPVARLVFRGAHRPSPVEVEQNPRSESARLRAVERLPDVGEPGVPDSGGRRS
jgi:16S rRNA (cytosine1402-N4)-methyltransferase